MLKRNKKYEISNDGKISTYPSLYKAKEKWTFRLFLKRFLKKDIE